MFSPVKVLSPPTALPQDLCVAMFCLSVLMVMGMTGLCLGASVQELLCPVQHSCSAPRSTYDPPPTGCSCDAACRIYGDCCRDSEHYDEAEQRRNVNEYMCVREKYMKGKCLNDWNDVEVEALCLEGYTVSDLMMSLPVINTATNITYVNSYCAICNGENPNFLRMWQVTLECRNVPDDFFEKDYGTFEYKPLFNNGTWGYIPLNSVDSSFRPCVFIPTLSEDMKSITVNCNPTVNTCNDSLTWSQYVQSLCQSYSAAVYVFKGNDDSQWFRNEHCASCNGYEGDKSCHGPYGTAFYIPFTMLLDFSDWSGSGLVGLTGQCGPEEVWDGHAEKCRKIFCSNNGEKFIRGRCVPV